MNNTTRRKFIRKLGLTVGALTVGNELVHSFPFYPQKKERRVTKPSEPPLEAGIDFRYAPTSWQSTYCFPDDPHKSLVGKNGELLYGHPGLGTDWNTIPHIVSVQISGKEPLMFVNQQLESPSIPIIITTLSGSDILVELTSFATNHKDEGRVDNLVIVIRPKGTQEVECTPEILMKSAGKFSAEQKEDSSSSRDYIGIAQLDDESPSLFMIVDSQVTKQEGYGVHHFQLMPGVAKEQELLKYFVRFPQQGQELDRIKDGLERPDTLIVSARSFWQTWKPTEGKLQWQLPDQYQNFLIACSRNILQSREIKNGKGTFQVGPTVYRGSWIVDGHFMLEAARYLGLDKEAQEGLEAIWDRQEKSGAFFGGAGRSHWKDTAVAVYALLRQSELSQNWDYFRELYPDAFKAIMFLKELRDKAFNDGTSNGQYALLPRGYGDSGLSGVRSEFTNTLWAMVATDALLKVADRLFLPRRSELRDFYRDLRVNFFAAIRLEMRKHPKGFSYLPMLMKEDPQWNEQDERKQPRPQVAQVYLSQAIYPGLIFEKDHEIVTGHIELMKAVTEAEDVPIETGWLTDKAVWTYNAAIVAQVYLWAGMPDWARRTFIGFLNHASPLYAWREEQSLKNVPNPQYIGDMPHNWASAECIRYLRHMLILEDEDKLRLLDGLGKEDLEAGQAFVVNYSPTRWGRVSLTFEPLDPKTWRLKFLREDGDQRLAPKLTWVEMPRRFLPNFQYKEHTNGVKLYRNGPRIQVDPAATSWEIIWHDFSKS
ncbi:MAG: twin-arginine translocation signal domain-containing protein [Ignavibacteriae bacterium]|nr:twin-arginine translocation signal domain-containing protein [Ignavibacteriota bacterium]